MDAVAAQLRERGADVEVGDVEPGEAAQLGADVLEERVVEVLAARVGESSGGPTTSKPGVRLRSTVASKPVPPMLPTAIAPPSSTRCLLA